ncbi:YciI family protein [Massilia sp. PAMC28688]|uniref:YciI family protein n=1 Tax=Massilia sp. PAMC28688 TaxID=2861283 RepID=UPI001C62FE41|nr:YciI family protein [Massilia sp. PAMC28688]QYF95443.1 YciI family protein [Massilia sp. PAMC28688]
MSHMILRRADRLTEAGGDAGAGLLDVVFAPSAEAVRVSIKDGKATLTHGPFDDTVAGFSIIDAPSVPDAVEWLRRWPAGEEPAVLEIRQSGCPDNCHAIRDAAGSGDTQQRYAVLLRSSPDLEHEVPVARDKITALDAHNAAEAEAGTLVAADGLRGTARGARVKVARQAFSVIDGPFTEIKELIAGFWLIRAASMEDAIAWAIRNPYPTGPDVEVEIRPVLNNPHAAFGADLQSAEARMRAEQLEAGMRAHFTA